MNFEEIYDASYARVLKIKDEREAFFAAFYKRFLASSDEIAIKFVNTDMAKQQQMLTKSFYHLLVFYGSNQADDYIEKIARAHDIHHHNIEPHLYDCWLDTLMATVAEFDPEFNDNVELAWRLILTPGITYMKYKHAHTGVISAPD